MSSEGKAFFDLHTSVIWNELNCWPPKASLLLLWGQRVLAGLAWLFQRQRRVFYVTRRRIKMIIMTTMKSSIYWTCMCCINMYLLTHMPCRYCYYLYFANDTTVAHTEKAILVLQGKVWTYICLALADCFKHFAYINTARECLKHFIYINTFNSHDTPISHKRKLRQRVIKSFCWKHST